MLSKQEIFADEIEHIGDMDSTDNHERTDAHKLRNISLVPKLNFIIQLIKKWLTDIDVLIITIIKDQ